jgi:acyl homoserine lactone synthase
VHFVQTHRLQSMSPADAEGMFRLRYDTFHTRLGWDVSTDDGMERDAFDATSAVYILGKTPDHRVDACWRLLPTVGPYMLKDTFPELLHGQPAPQALDVWEMSRFALATERVATSAEGFGPLSVSLMAEAARFAMAHGISRYVTVTTLAIERLLKRQGVHIHRLGPPVRIGIAMTVACVVEVDDTTLQAVNVERPLARQPSPALS